jgi:hypothetical protein
VHRCFDWLSLAVGLCLARSALGSPDGIGAVGEGLIGLIGKKNPATSHHDDIASSKLQGLINAPAANLRSISGA